MNEQKHSQLSTFHSPLAFYWIELLYQSEEITIESYESIKPDIQELLKLLVSIVKTSKEKLGHEKS